MPTYHPQSDFLPIMQCPNNYHTTVVNQVLEGRMKQNENLKENLLETLPKHFVSIYGFILNHISML